MTRRIAPTQSAYTYPLLIKQLWHTPLAHSGDREIVYRDRVRSDYRTMRARIGRLASALTALGIKPGDTVAVMDWDSHRYLECYFAVPMMGAVLQTVNIRLSPAQIAYTLNHAEARAVLVHADFAPLLAPLLAELPNLSTIVLLSDGDAATAPFANVGEYESLLADAASDFAFPDFDENTIATTFYTTGTTGLPKGVFFSHRQIVLHTLAGMAAFGSQGAGQRFHRDDVYMPITPMFHVHAWGMPYIATLLGVKQVYPGRYAPDLLLALRRREGVTFSHCVPTILQMLLAEAAKTNERLDGWKMVIGGSAMSVALCEAALARGIDAFTGYGMSETCPLLTLAQLTPGDADPIATRTKSGRPIPLVELRTVDEAMADAPRDGKSSGEIVARAPWLTQGYLKQPEASEQLWRGGFLHTNDIGWIDQAGYLKITDRLKDVIKTGGEWVSSLDVEDLIARLAGVGEVAVIGAPDAKWGERPIAIVARRAQAPAVDEAAIKAHVAGFAGRGVISKFAIPDRVVFVETLDKTSVGKIDKKALRQRYAG
jgi:fatty-acyl-CoA synthase